MATKFCVFKADHENWHPTEITYYTAHTQLIVGTYDDNLLLSFTAPGDVTPPSVIANSSTSLQVTWKEPTTPNGIIISYSLFNVTTGGDTDTLLTISSVPRSFYVDGLEPFTEYGFIVEVCTVAGCTESGVGSGRTGESGMIRVT